jgi:AcrR family transcriptional regulator
MNRPEARELLLVAGTELFAARGIAAVSVDDILKLAGVSIPTLYRAYEGGKAGLIAATLQRWSRAQLDRMRAAVQSGEDAQQQLERLLAVLGDWFGEPDFRGSYVTNTAAEDATLEELAEQSAAARAAVEEARAAITEHRQAERALLVELARAAITEHRQSAGAIDPEGLADQLQVVLDGTVEGAKLAPAARRPVIVATARAIALSLLTAAAGRPPAQA